MTKPALYEMLRNKYQIGDHFIAAYLTGAFDTPEVDMEMYNQKMAATPNLANWLDYAFSTNQRGREFASALRPHLPPNPRRYLDVGSAYGGFLIGFMELGMEVKGIEYSQRFVDMSRANFLDYGLEDASILGDILDPALLPGLGKFDVITCVDVIEHVDDVPAAMKNMVDLLNPGGILVLQMPNKDSLTNILTDPHFGIFGLTLLKHDEARAFYFYNFPERKMYDVGEFYEQGHYLNLLTALNCQASALPPMSPTSLLRKARLLPRFLLRWLKFLFDGSLALPLGLRLKVALLALAHFGWFAIQFIFSIPFTALRPGLKARYADDAWLILGRKKS